MRSAIVTLSLLCLLPALSGCGKAIRYMKPKFPAAAGPWTIPLFRPLTTNGPDVVVTAATRDGKKKLVRTFRVDSGAFKSTIPANGSRHSTWTLSAPPLRRSRTRAG